MIATMLKMCASEKRLGDKKQKFKDPCYSSRIMGDFFFSSLKKYV